MEAGQKQEGDCWSKSAGLKLKVKKTWSAFPFHPQYHGGEKKD